MPPKKRRKGKSAPRGKAPSRHKVVKRKVTQKAEPQLTAEQLLEKVEECLDSFQWEAAVAHCERALQLEPRSLAVLDVAGPLLLEVGLTDKALDCFQTAVVLSPEEGHSKYMYLGQLTSGQQAVNYFSKGIEIMSRKLEGDGSAAVSASVTREDVSSAYCAMAEVYLTDSCLTPEAEQCCYDCCTKAVEWCPTHPEAYQAMASCLLSKEQTEEAKEKLLKGVSLWLPGDGEERQAEVPLYPSRVTCAKLLLELGELERAFSVLEGLLREDDEVVGVWYLMGWLHFLWKDRDSAIFYLQQTEKLFSKLECDDAEILEHTRELLQELMENRGLEEEVEDEEEEEREEEEEDEEGEEEEEASDTMDVG